MLAGIYREIVREAWCTVPGREMQFTNNADGNPVKIGFYEGENLVFVKNFTYDENGNILKIICTNS